VQFNFKTALIIFVVGVLLGSIGMYVFCGKYIQFDRNGIDQIAANNQRIIESQSAIITGLDNLSKQLGRVSNQIKGVSNGIGQVNDGIAGVSKILGNAQGTANTSNGLIKEQSGILEAVKKRGPIKTN
jgi:methyl-accepting chemotaxis protein